MTARILLDTNRMLLRNKRLWNIGGKFRSTSVTETPEESFTRIETEEKPSVYDIVMYNYRTFALKSRKALKLLQPKFESSLELLVRLERDGLHKKIRGIARLIESTVIVFKVNFPVKRDSGDYDIITGYRVHHCQHRLPVKGGLRFLPDTSEDDLRGLAALMTFRNGTLKVPFGGANGAVLINPEDYSEGELERITRQYTLELLKKNIIGPGTDVMGTDINTGPREMAWLYDTFISTFGHGDIHALAVSTGKPRAVGGMQGRFSATGLGITNVLQSFLTNKHIMDEIGLEPSWENKTVIVQGFGNIGEHSAVHIARTGAKVIGVIEKEAALFNENGINIPSLVEYKKKHRNIKGFSGAQEVDPPESLMFRKCDILLPAFKERVITNSNVDKIQAKIIVEGANAPVTPGAHSSLVKRKVLVIPDILASGGGVTCSFFEWLKNVNRVSFGRLSFGYSRYSMEKVLRSIGYSLEAGLNKKINVSLSPKLYKRMYEPTEKNILESSVTHTMEIAVNEVLEVGKEFKLGLDVRAANYCYSTFRIFQVLAEGGLSY